MSVALTKPWMVASPSVGGCTQSYCYADPNYMSVGFDAVQLFWMIVGVVITLSFMFPWARTMLIFFPLAFAFVLVREGFLGWVYMMYSTLYLAILLVWSNGLPHWSSGDQSLTKYVANNGSVVLKPIYVNGVKYTPQEIYVTTRFVKKSD